MKKPRARTAPVSAARLIFLSRKHQAALEKLYNTVMRTQLASLNATLRAQAPRATGKALEAMAWGMALCPTCRGTGQLPPFDGVKSRHSRA